MYSNKFIIKKLLCSIYKIKLLKNIIDKLIKFNKTIFLLNRFQVVSKTIF